MGKPGKPGYITAIDPIPEDTPEEMHDILHSIGALGPQVKASEKQKANENKKKGYAKAKTIGKKYG
jgi:hypothetical protein